MIAEHPTPPCDSSAAPASITGRGPQTAADGGPPPRRDRCAELELEHGTLRLLEVEQSPRRIPRDAAAGGGSVSLLVQIEGSAQVAGHRRPQRIGPGEICLLAPGRDIWIDRQRAVRQLLVDLPTTPASSAPALQRLDGRQPEVRAAAALARYVSGHHDHLAPAERHALGDALLRMIERIAEGDAGAAAGAPGENAAMRQRRRAEAFILERLHDRRLDVAHIAAHLGVSTRYLHRLFDDGRQVMQWVQEQRLQACWQELRSRRGRPVAEVAWAWGFTSPAHFSRTFKRRFGVPPSAV